MVATYDYSPGVLDLKMIRGFAWSMGTEVNKDLTGYEVVAAVVLDDGDEIAIQVEVDPGATVSRIDYFLSAADTMDLPLGNCRWYMAWTPPS